MKKVVFRIAKNTPTITDKRWLETDFQCHRIGTSSVKLPLKLPL